MTIFKTILLTIGLSVFANQNLLPMQQQPVFTANRSSEEIATYLYDILEYLYNQHDVRHLTREKAIADYVKNDEHQFVQLNIDSWDELNKEGRLKIIFEDIKNVVDNPQYDKKSWYEKGYSAQFFNRLINLLKYKFSIIASEQFTILQSFAEDVSKKLLEPTPEQKGINYFDATGDIIKKEQEGIKFKEYHRENINYQDLMQYVNSLGQVEVFVLSGIPSQYSYGEAGKSACTANSLYLAIKMVQTLAMNKGINVKDFQKYLKNTIYTYYQDLKYEHSNIFTYKYERQAPKLKKLIFEQNNIDTNIKENLGIEGYFNQGYNVISITCAPESYALFKVDNLYGLVDSHANYFKKIFPQKNSFTTIFFSKKLDTLTKLKGIIAPPGATCNDAGIKVPTQFQQKTEQREIIQDPSPEFQPQPPRSQASLGRFSSIDEVIKLGNKKLKKVFDEIVEKMGKTPTMFEKSKPFKVLTNSLFVMLDRKVFNEYEIDSKIDGLATKLARGLNKYSREDEIYNKIKREIDEIADQQKQRKTEIPQPDTQQPIIQPRRSFDQMPDVSERQPSQPRIQTQDTIKWEINIDGLNLPENIKKKLAKIKRRINRLSKILDKTAKTINKILELPKKIYSLANGIRKDSLKHAILDQLSDIHDQSSYSNAWFIYDEKHEIARIRKKHSLEKLIEIHRILKKDVYGVAAWIKESVPERAEHRNEKIARAWIILNNMPEDIFDRIKKSQRKIMDKNTIFKQIKKSKYEKSEDLKNIELKFLYHRESKTLNKFIDLFNNKYLEEWKKNNN